MTLKEELAKYKSNIIKPAFLPLYIFLHEMYEKRSKEVRKQYVLSDALWERKFNHIEAEIKKREKFTEIEPAETKQIFFDNYQLLQHRRMPKNVREKEKTGKENRPVQCFEMNNQRCALK
jgi:hypothetical protein